MTFEVKILTPDGQSVLEFEDLEAYKLEGVIENYIDLRKMSDFSFIVTTVPFELSGLCLLSLSLSLIQQ